METPKSQCAVCGRAFEVKFRYQVREEDGSFLYFCSQICHQTQLTVTGGCRCTVCGRGFTLEHPFQAATDDGRRLYYCSTSCRSAAPALRPPRSPRRIAVFNHKGGTGKTTTAVNLAAGLAEIGQRVLLIDADGQGNVGVSLGIRGERTLYHVLVAGADVDDVAVPVRKNLDVLTSNETLAAAELLLATKPNRDRVLRERLGDRARGYDSIVIDCAPALSLMNQNVLAYADSVIVPVSCDYLSLIGMRQVLRTLRSVRELLGHEVDLLGVLPTFYDVRNRISRESMQSLADHFGDRVLPPIRINTRLREAPYHKKTIFEHAPDSHGAEDYLALVEAVRAVRRRARQPAAVVQLGGARGPDAALRAPVAMPAPAVALRRFPLKMLEGQDA